MYVSEVYCQNCGDFLGYNYPGNNCLYGCEPRIYVQVLTHDDNVPGMAIVRKDRILASSYWTDGKTQPLGVLMAWDRLTSLQIKTLRMGWADADEIKLRAMALGRQDSVDSRRRFR